MLAFRSVKGDGSLVAVRAEYVVMVFARSEDECEVHLHIGNDTQMVRVRETVAHVVEAINRNGAPYQLRGSHA